MANEKTPQYFHVSKTALTRVKKNTPQLKSKSNNDSDLINPVFNFSKTFGDNFLKVKPIELGASEPYISLEIMNLAGQPVQNLNVAFFQKQMDFKAINGVGRYSDRPLISLKNVEISTDLSAGSYFYFVRVALTIKIHKKDQLSDRAILALLYPGCPIMMTYGWNSKNDFLNQKQKLLMNVVSYTINIDETGQADLTVQCMAFDNLITGTIVGDTNTLEVSNKNVSKEEFQGLFHNYKQLDYFISYLEQLEKTSNKNQNDYKIIQDQLKSYRTLGETAKGKLSEKYSGYIEKLPDISQDFKFGKTKTKIATFHDIVYTFCDETFKSVSSLIPLKNFEIVYGNFNDKCFDFSGQSIGDFPIDYNRFLSWIRNTATEGQRVVYLKSFLDNLVREFVENQEYMRKLSDSEGKEFDQPNINVMFISLNDTVTLYITDLKSEIPPTMNQLKDIGKSSIQDAQDKTISGLDIPTISLSNATSFIKDITFSRIDDPSMETVLIERTRNNSIYSPRDFILESQMEGAQSSQNPLTLPLQGSMTSIGHVGWMPFRAFYLSTGIFLLDAIYKITKVTHNLSEEGFWTNIEFFWH